MNPGARKIHTLMPTTQHQHWKKSSLSSPRCTAPDRAQLLGRRMRFTIFPSIRSSTTRQGNPSRIQSWCDVFPLSTNRTLELQRQDCGQRWPSWELGETLRIRCLPEPVGLGWEKLCGSGQNAGGGIRERAQQGEGGMNWSVPVTELSKREVHH